VFFGACKTSGPSHTYHSGLLDGCFYNPIHIVTSLSHFLVESVTVICDMVIFATCKIFFSV
jgi:hypothetical protein